MTALRICLFLAILTVPLARVACASEALDFYRRILALERMAVAGVKNRSVAELFEVHNIIMKEITSKFKDSQIIIFPILGCSNAHSRLAIPVLFFASMIDPSQGGGILGKEENFKHAVSAWNDYLESIRICEGTLELPPPPDRLQHPSELLRGDPVTQSN